MGILGGKDKTPIRPTTINSFEMETIEDDQRNGDDCRSSSDGSATSGSISAASSGCAPISVRVYVDREEQRRRSFTDSYKAEDLCYKLGKELQISPAVITQFALRRVDEASQRKYWVKPNQTITSGKFEFRLMVYQHVSNDDNCDLAEPALNFAFHQYRDDFLRVNFDRGEQKYDEEIQGLAVIDMTRVCKEDGLSADQLKMRYKQFVPPSWRKRFTWAQKRRIKQNLKRWCSQYLNSQVSADASHLKQMYLSQLSKVLHDIGKERYEEYGGDGRVLLLSPTNGIQIEGETKSNNFNDIISAEITIVHNSNGVLETTAHSGNGEITEHGNQDPCQTMSCQCPVSVCLSRRNDPPLVLKLVNREMAESLVVYLDACYRHLVNFSHYLCEDCRSPLLMRLPRSKCHGPIRRDDADNLLKHSLDDGTYILRMHPSEYDCFCLTIRHMDRTLNFLIATDPTTKKVYLERRYEFDNLQELIGHYSNQQNATSIQTRLSKCLRPGTAQIQEPSPNPHFPFRPENIRTESGEMLPAGTFCSVHRGYVTLEGKESSEFAIKKLKDTSLEGDFFRGAEKMSFLTCNHIIRVYGFSMNSKCVVLDLCPGSLEYFLSGHRRDEIQYVGLIEAVVRITEALEYLEEKGFAHGSVALHNIFVKQYNKFLNVQLGDCLLSHVYYHLDDNHPQKLKRSYFMAPELSTGRQEPTLEGDKFSFAIFVWCTFKKGFKPFGQYNAHQIRQTYKMRERPLVPESWPYWIHEVISKSWSHDPDERIPFKDILRLLRSHTAAVSLEALESQFGTDHELEVALAQAAATSKDSVLSQVQLAESPESTQAAGSLIPPHLPGGRKYDPEDILEPFLPHETDHIDSGSIELCSNAFLGKGKFGLVCHAIWRPLKAFSDQRVDVAVKKICPEHQNTDAFRFRAFLAEFRREIDNIVKLKHENIVSVLGVNYGDGTENELMLVMEYMPKGSLKSYLLKKSTEEHQPVGNRTLVNFALQISKGMQYLEEKKVIHRDLAARNILVDSTERKVKISDFGLSRVIQDKDYYRWDEASLPYRPVFWWAPECIGHCTYTSKSDVWSFSVTLWEMFSPGCSPSTGYFYPGTKNEVPHSKLYDFLEQSEQHRLPRPPLCPPTFYLEVMKPCWYFLEVNRPSFTRLVTTIEATRGRLFSHTDSDSL